MSPTASRYNLIENGDFRFSGSPAANWTASGLSSTDSVVSTNNSAAPQLDNNVLQIVGLATAAKRVDQTISISGSAGDTYIVSGWAKADSVPLESTDTRGREFAVALIFNNTDGTTARTVARFNPDTNAEANWQYC